MKQLLIAEKPSLGRGIGESLGEFSKRNGYLENDKYIITWGFGHLFTLASVDDYLGGTKTSWGDVPLPFFPEPFQFKIKENCQEQFKRIETLCQRNDVSEIIHCGDPDREGEVIVRIILNHIDHHLPIKRLWVNDTVGETIVNGMEELEPLSRRDKEYQEGLARMYMDWLLGINLTRYITLKKGITLPVGRVLIPIVKRIYDRDMEIATFEVSTYYQLQQTIERDGAKVSVSLSDKFDKIDKDRLNGLNQGEIVVKKVEQKKKVIAPKKLHKLSKLQSQCNEVYKMPFARSLEIIQSLYEKGYLTYPRTDSEYLTKAETEKISEIVERLKNNVDIALKSQSKVFNDEKVEGHSAITITAKLGDDLIGEEKQVYDLVFHRFLANFSQEDCVISETKVTLQIEDTEKVITGKSMITRGWTRVEAGGKDKMIPNFVVGERIPCDFVFEEKKTTPPEKISEKSLSSYLENPFAKSGEDDDLENIRKGLSIGTQATRTAIIQSALRYEYISIEDSIFSIEQKGRMLINTLNKLEIDLYPERTVIFTKLLRDVFEGKVDVEKVVEEIREEISNLILMGNRVEIERIERKREPVGVNCPLCKSEIYSSPKSYYCSGYKGGCKFILWKDNLYLKSMGKSMTEAMAKEFIGKGKCKITGLISKKTGKKFDATIQVRFTPEGKCDYNMEFEEKSPLHRLGKGGNSWKSNKFKS